TEWGCDAWLGVFIDALEVRDDLHEVSEETRKEGGFGAGGGVPGSGTSARRQARVALTAESVADQICRVSRRHGNSVRSGWRRDLRRRKGDSAECTCEQESASEQAPNSSRFFRLLIELVAHLFVLHFSVLVRLRSRHTTSSKAVLRITACEPTGP